MRLAPLGDLAPPSDPIGYRKVKSSANPGSIDGRKARQGRREGLLHFPEFVAKLRRLADALETGERFEIQVAGQRVHVPPAPSSTSSTSGRGRGGDRVPAEVDQPVSSSTFMLSTRILEGPARASRCGPSSSWPYSLKCVERLYEKPSNTGEPPRHEANHGSIYERLAARTQPLVIFAHPPLLVDPRNSPFHTHLRGKT